MFGYRNTPERLAFRDVEGKARAAQISEARASQAAAREDLKRAMQTLSLTEALDLLTCHYSALMTPKELHDAMQIAERATERRCEVDHLERNGANLARMVGGE